ncbi:PHB depolymerase family esterase [Asticcacaulis sp. YBE204]|uniref:extracellular catalytic domain type 1 short-chain-length polyhydroxyalkanoate depolymerase n=1 Tax=Asticcacaulis sp. YBE204 TaxID=1282363 RepID=UPI0003C3CF89|nr:PHB depolymerase family esterase [Asticcacaulis sp. YBE204]ESQ79390.1 hypothetical protein AEYBE204_10295 [Asticcacaulis sp. YBE204]
MKLNIDMAEATRLTRLGKLDEAMAILRGEGPVSPSTESVSPDAPAFIDMVPGAGDGTSWRAAFDVQTEATAVKPKFDLSDLVKRQKAFTTTGRGHSKGPAVPTGARFDDRHFTNASGSRDYKLYVPSTYGAEPVPLIVMLHGCTQSVDDFAVGTRMNDLAETHGFLVAYPVQSQTANMNRCWNWFNTSDQHRDQGEPALIAGITLQVMNDYLVDSTRVFVAGLSAGGAMAAIMGEAYPELYAAVGVHSGLPVGAAHDMPSAFAAMSQGASAAARRGKAVRTILFHGDADRTVHAKNGDQFLAQAGTDRLKHKVVTGTTTSGMPYTQTVLKNGASTPVIEHWRLHGAGHAWSGGAAAGSYTEPRGPDASAEMVRFFLTPTN